MIRDAKKENNLIARGAIKKKISSTRYELEQQIESEIFILYCNVEKLIFFL